MSTQTTDPLLLAAKALIRVMQAILGFVGLVFILAIPAAFIFPTEATSIITEGFPNSTLEQPALAITIFSLFMIAMLAVAFWFFALLYQIVRSVELGDPFDITNATRLTKMAWIALASQVLQFPFASLAYNLARDLGPPQEGTLRFETGIEVGVILFALVLFILARVFRHGAAMRADLEGTV